MLGFHAFIFAVNLVDLRSDLHNVTRIRRRVGTIISHSLHAFATRSPRMEQEIELGAWERKRSPNPHTECSYMTSSAYGAVWAASRIKKHYHRSLIADLDCSRLSRPSSAYALVSINIISGSCSINEKSSSIR